MRVTVSILSVEVAVEAANSSLVPAGKVVGHCANASGYVVVDQCNKRVHAYARASEVEGEPSGRPT